MKKLMLVVSASFSAFMLTAATTITVHSSYDETKGKWIGNVTELVTALSDAAYLDTVQLEKGDYDLTGVRMQEDGAQYGNSHLLVPPGVKVVAVEADRDVTRLIGDGTCRVVRVVPPDYTTTWVPTTLRGLTVTNGYAKAVTGAADSKQGGGIFGNLTLTNCVVVGCKADGNGGGVHGTGVNIWQSALLGNVAQSNGGGVSGQFGNEKVIGSTVAGNTAVLNGGGVYACGTVSNSVVSSNIASGSGGGVYVSTATKCLVYGSLVCSNKAYHTSNDVYGGGAYRCLIVGGRLFANYGRNAGGAYQCVLTNVVVHNNYTPNYGGGLSSCSMASGCVISNNFAGSSGPNVLATSLDRCEVTGTGANGGVASRCVFHHIGPTVEIAGNPWVSGIASANGNLFEGSPVCTNCLFVNNTLGSSYRSMFTGSSNPSRSIRLVNCTIVSNVFGQTFGNVANGTYPADIRNSVFVWNRRENGTSGDIHAASGVDSSGIRFTNCAYGTSSELFADMTSFADGPLYQFGQGGFPANPRFVLGDAKHPYEPKHSSPLRGRAAVDASWMATATDIRGEGYARLRDNKADIGCYQCWLDPIGMVLLFR